MDRCKLLLLFVTVLMLGCTQGHEPLTQSTPKPPRQKPGEELEQENLVWTYVETASDGSETRYPECVEPFKIGSSCAIKGDRCHRLAHIMACYPDDQQVRVYGQVVDENGEPLGGVRVMGGLGFPGYTNLSETVTNKQGDFVVKAGFCLNVVYTQLDGYASPNDYFVSSMLTGCRVENYTGAKDVVVTMKRLPRTTNPAHAPKPKEGECQVFGRVVDDSGQPIQGAKVLAALALGPSGSSGYVNIPVVMTDEFGEYVVRSSPPCPDMVSAEHPDYEMPYRSMARATCLAGQPADIVLNKKK